MKWRKDKPTAKKSTEPLTPWEKAQLQQKKPIDSNFWRNLKATNLPAAKQKQKLTQPRKHLRHTTGQPMALSLRIIIYGCVAVLLAIIWYVSPLNQLQQVTVTGASSPLRSDVSQIIKAKFHKHSRMVRVWRQSNAMKAKLKRELKQLKAVKFNYQDRKLVVQLTQYRTVAQLQVKNKYYLISSNGAVSPHATSSLKTTVPVITGVKRNSKKITQIVEQLRQLKQNVLSDISEITPQAVSYDPSRLRLAMNDGTIVYVRLHTFAHKMQYYPSIRKQMKKKGYVNLEVGAYSYY